MRRTRAAVVAVCASVLTACGTKQAAAPTSTRPVPTMLALAIDQGGSQGPDAVIVLWSTGNGATGEVVLRAPDGKETNVARASDGCQVVPLPSPGSPFELRLHEALGARRLLKAVAVPRAVSSAALVAVPNPARTVGDGFATAYVGWTIGDRADRSTGQVYVTYGSRPEQLFADRPAGCSTAPWIGDNIYDFRLYAGQNRARSLAKVSIELQRERAPNASLWTEPSADGSGVIVHWDSGNGVPGEVRWSSVGGAEAALASGDQGSAVLPRNRGTPSIVTFYPETGTPIRIVVP